MVVINSIDCKTLNIGIDKLTHPHLTFNFPRAILEPSITRKELMRSAGNTVQGRFLLGCI